jgi:hypothetical protein
MSKRTKKTEPGISQNTSQTDQPTLLTRRQLAQRWSCCPHTIARRKDLQPVRFGRRLLRYRLSDVEAVEAAAIGVAEEAA